MQFGFAYALAWSYHGNCRQDGRNGRMVNGNVLDAIRELDNRFVPDANDDKDDARDAYNS